MKLLIAVDMEGITGVVSLNHVDSNHVEYQRFRRMMTADVNAAIQGAVAAGVETIVVSDGHGNGDNILVEELDARASLNSGSPSPFAMVQGINQGVDVVFFIGYHARMGTPSAILDHTWSSRSVQNVWLNGRVTGETGLNASLCGHYGVPVLLVTGDQSVNAEAQEWISGIEGVVVKQASGRLAAELLPPAVTQKLIREAAERSIKNFLSGRAPASLVVQTPVNLVIEFLYSDMADRAIMMPGSRRLDGHKIELVLEDMPAAYLAFRSAVQLAQR